MVLKVLGNTNDAHLIRVVDSDGAVFLLHVVALRDVLTVAVLSIKWTSYRTRARL